MKFTTPILFFAPAVLAAAVSESPATANSSAVAETAAVSAAYLKAAAECGDLGVLSVVEADLPAGVNRAEVRTCLEHPLKGAHERHAGSLAPLDNAQIEAAVSAYDRRLASAPTPELGALEARACYYEAPYGCSDGYCWKACGSAGDGKWCWTANNLGWGSWITCHTYNDCGSTTYSCGQGGCDACGCSC